MIANLRVGETFKGATQSYISHATRRFEYELGGEVIEIRPRMGDRPAVNVVPDGEGLVTIVHTTADNIVTYRDIDKFANFVTHKDAPGALAAQKADGVTESGFREVYSRYAKSLVALGSGEGQDREFGLETELVALENPYTDDMTDGLDVVLFYEGRPRSDAQIEIFERSPDTNVMVSVVRTDEQGRATVPVRAGNTYMLDAVVIRRPSPELAEERNAVWESLWANLTFLVPE